MGKKNGQSKAVSEVQEKVKRCSQCKRKKSLEDFYNDFDRLDKKAHACKKCYYQIRKRLGYNTYKKREKTLTKYRKNNKLKIIARVKVAIALKNRIIKKNIKCELCGKKNTEAHHPNYLKALEIKWLCHKCHTNIHKNLDNMSTYPKRVVIGDQVLYVMDKAQEMRFRAQCAERSRLNSQPMPKRLTNKK